MTKRQINNIGIGFVIKRENDKEMLNRYFVREFADAWGFKVIDPEEYDIIPKPAVIKREIQNLESAIDTRRRLREAAVERYDKEIRELEDELQKQRKRLKP